MASRRLFIGNLNYNTDQEGLKTAFSEFGEVKDAKIITDRDTGRARGFGFVEFSSEADAAKAINAMNGEMLDGRKIIVNEAEERKGGGGGGGYRPRDNGGGGSSRDLPPPPMNDPPPGGGGGGGGKGGRGSKRGGRDRDDDRW